MRRARSSRGLVNLLSVLVLLSGCGDGATRDIERAAKQGDYGEVVALSRHALRSDDRAVLRYYYGIGLVGMGRDLEGFAELDRAVAEDGKYARRGAEFLWEQALKKPGTPAAAHRMRKASQLDPSIDLGRYRFAVADVCLGERSYSDAARLYEEAIAAYPDSSACEAAYARLAECWAELNEPEKAKEAMEALVQKYPRGSLAGRAEARLDDLSFDQAQEAFDAADYEKAIEMAKQIVESTANRSLQQKARYLLGESFEAMGDAAGAYGAYRDIIRSDRGDSGRVVERARARIEALQEAGLQ